ncbi:peroxiredoxin [Pelobacter propionicus]|jgi:peroxiredoxin (alkyl hydroperoxide reductase subunit C)|uniref:Thioredoxin peroxidase n=1 Tax=Pelobacter propionicus (strain DSM 2379 / NBRC 103807 / OttBd1) TaxID=338966 RepID=A1AL94_PELPD|nr:peroxiredoxin [Pelobacter propionicus]ABK98114.1 alkyl hydroperoxide reductase/ Thiol specific antioxidant/ Mal allergen [Pelobacter propionicus DSM 2379]
MSLTTLVTQQAPDFTAEAVMADNSFASITLSSLKGKFVLLLFYPLDFTFVCPSEILAFNRQIAAFKAKNCEVIGISVDSKFTHLAWKNTPIENGGIGNIQFPLVQDLDREIAKSYGILLNNSVALRGLFLIDPTGTVRHCIINDLPLGRSVTEAIRMLDAIQFSDTHGEVCPANWQEGEEAMKPTTEGVADYLTRFAR